MPEQNDFIQSFIEGDEKGFRKLFDIYYPFYCIRAESYTKDMTIAEELVADVFTSISKEHHKFENESQIKAWLTVSVRNACVNHYKKEKRARQLKDSMPDPGYKEEPSENEQIEDAVLAKIYRDIEILSTKCRAVFQYYFLEGMNVKEIALLMNISVQTVYSHKKRAIKLLRKALGNKWADDNLK